MVSGREPCWGVTYLLFLNEMAGTQKNREVRMYTTHLPLGEKYGYLLFLTYAL